MSKRTTDLTAQMLTVFLSFSLFFSLLLFASIAPLLPSPLSMAKVSLLLLIR